MCLSTSTCTSLGTSPSGRVGVGVVRSLGVRVVPGRVGPTLERVGGALLRVGLRATGSWGRLTHTRIPTAACGFVFRGAFFISWLLAFGVCAGAASFFLFSFVASLECLGLGFWRGAVRVLAACGLRLAFGRGRRRSAWVLGHGTRTRLELVLGLMHSGCSSACA
ncbi:hypothetical protein B0H13DRAFT_2080505, partial [Mycena leptocephala]